MGTRWLARLLVVAALTVAWAPGCDRSAATARGEDVERAPRSGAPSRRSSKPEPRLRSGDLVFQRSQSRQSEVVAAVTQSRFTHMGVVFVDGDRVRVLEAVQPVRYTDLDAWTRRGEEGRYVVRRLRDAERILTRAAVRKLQREGERFLGRPYDGRFAWSDDAMYCSELAFKTYDRALGIRLGEPQRWRDLDLTSPAARRLAKRRLGHLPDPDALVITPARMFASSALVTVPSQPGAD